MLMPTYIATACKQVTNGDLIMNHLFQHVDSCIIFEQLVEHA